MPYVTTNVRLDPDVYAHLRTEALVAGMSIAEAIRRALRAHVAGGGGPAALSEAREQPPYTAAPGAPGAATGLAIGKVRNGTLVVPADGGTPELPEDTPLLVAILGPARDHDLAAMRRQHEAREALRRELAELPEAPPPPVSADDRETYDP